jgi:hypothetical protein
MTDDLTRIDRLRIERTIWAFDVLIINMPRRSRVAKRRELRANLRAAAADVGTAQALRRLGGLQRLAAGYLAAEYGERGPRPAYWKGITWASLLLPIMIAAEDLGKQSFLDGVQAIPRATGVFHYSGMKFLGLDFTYTFLDGRNMAPGWSESFSSVELIYMLAAFLIGARTWRLLPPWRRWRLRRVDAASDQ